MKHKGEDCWSVSREELLAHMRAGAVLWWSKYGPHYRDPASRRECHPRRDTVRKLLDAGTLVESPDANEVQRRCGMYTYRLAQPKDTPC